VNATKKNLSQTLTAVVTIMTIVMMAAASTTTTTMRMVMSIISDDGGDGNHNYDKNQNCNHIMHYSAYSTAY